MYTRSVDELPWPREQGGGVLCSLGPGQPGSSAPTDNSILYPALPPDQSDLQPNPWAAGCWEKGGRAREDEGSFPAIQGQGWRRASDGLSLQLSRAELQSAEGKRAEQNFHGPQPGSDVSIFGGDPSAAGAENRQTDSLAPCPGLLILGGQARIRVPPSIRSKEYGVRSTQTLVTCAAQLACPLPAKVPRHLRCRQTDSPSAGKRQATGEPGRLL